MDGTGNGNSKRGRKPGSAATSTHERALKKLATLEKARDEARKLEREAEQRSALIVGRVVLEAARAHPETGQWLRVLLREAKLSARDRAEIAHLLIEPEPTAPSATTAARHAPPAAASAFASK